MYCTNCGGKLDDSDVFCPGCGKRQVTSVRTESPQQPSGQISGGTQLSIPTYAFDAERLTPVDWVAGVATLVVFISLFLPWFGISFGIGSITVDGLTTHGYLYIVLLLTVAEVIYLVALAGWKDLRTRVPIAHGTIIGVLNALILLIVLIGFLDKPGGGPVGWRFGSVVGLIAAFVAAVPNLAVSTAKRIRRT